MADPRFFFDSLKGKTILDEIQQAPDLLSYAKIKIDAHRDQKGLFIFTGSQQFHMIKNLGDSLAGRVALLDLLPLAVPEIQSARPFTTTEDLFVNACLTGSYPELIANPSINPSLWYASYIQTYLERDVRSLFNVVNLRDFQRFIQLLAIRCGQILKLTDFSNELGISVPTVKNWLSILEACRIIYLLHPYYNNPGKRIVKSPKIYFLDCGIACYLTGLKDRDHLLHGPMAGPMFENFCVQETVKFFFNHGKRPNLYYVRTNNDLEIDLLIETSINSLIPVEIKLNKTPSSGMAKHLDRFRKTFSEFELAQGRLVSLADRSFPLTRETLAVSFQDYLRDLSDLLKS
jgi:hypothetical protein